MTNQRLSFIVKTLMIQKRRGARLNGKSVLEKELAEWINGPTIICHTPWEPQPACCAPIPYEEQFKLNNILIPA